jgi:hypothetical protein
VRLSTSVDPALDDLRVLERGARRARGAGVAEGEQSEPRAPLPAHRTDVASHRHAAAIRSLDEVAIAARDAALAAGKEAQDRPLPLVP